MSGGISRAWGHFKVVTRHRWTVRKYCFRLGLYWQGLIHDLSKYSRTEFSVGVKYFTGKRSPNDYERIDKGYSESWMHHKGRNKHHFEYWIDYSLDPNEVMAGLRMPRKYVAEMVCDRVAASRIYAGDKYTTEGPRAYYQRGKGKLMIHPETRRELEYILDMLADKGEDAAFDYIKNVYLKEYPDR